jgi:pantoate--beta-alanine ligase
LSTLPTTRTVADVREMVREWRANRHTVALVPTMGNLHEGHLSLVRLARRAADRVVVSIFVNPTQFAAGEDFLRYPRTLEADRVLLQGDASADLLFAPDETVIYPYGTEAPVQVIVPRLGEELCGASRPGHFIGVATVVCRLLNIVMPDVLLLGEKDYQQFIVLQRMVADLSIPVRVQIGPIQRASDGLALSSRNQFLSPAERAVAPELHATLMSVRQALAEGATDFAALEGSAGERLVRAGLVSDYVQIRRADDLSRPTSAVPLAALVVLGAAWLGRTRLIDNLRGSG